MVEYKLILNNYQIKYSYLIQFFEKLKVAEYSFCKVFRYYDLI